MASREKQFLVARWENRREALKTLVDQAEPHQKKEIYRGWTLKEFLAHMSGWDDAVIESLHAHLEGTPFLIPAARGVNAITPRLFQRVKHSIMVTSAANGIAHMT